MRNIFHNNFPKFDSINKVRACTCTEQNTHNSKKALNDVSV